LPGPSRRRRCFPPGVCVYVAGANYAHQDISIGAINYYSDDIINTFYTEAKYTLPGTVGNRLTLGGQYPISAAPERIC